MCFLKPQCQLYKGTSLQVVVLCLFAGKSIHEPSYSFLYLLFLKEQHESYAAWILH